MLLVARLTVITNRKAIGSALRMTIKALTEDVIRAHNITCTNIDMREVVLHMATTAMAMVRIATNETTVMTLAMIMIAPQIVVAAMTLSSLVLMPIHLVAIMLEDGTTAAMKNMSSMIIATHTTTIPRLVIAVTLNLASIPLRLSRTAIISMSALRMTVHLQDLLLRMTDLRMTDLPVLRAPLAGCRTTVRLRRTILSTDP